MKYNTFDNYSMTAKYRPFIFAEREANSGILYREYQEAEEVACKVVINGVGTPLLFTKTALLQFGLVSGFTDVGGTPFLEDATYTVNKVEPVFDPAGYIYAYQHPLATASAMLINEPINPPPEWEDIDQVP